MTNVALDNGSTVSVSLEYDSFGMLLQETERFNDEVQEIRTFIYSEDGTLFRVERDTDLDGLPNSSLEFELNDDDNVTRIFTVDTDDQYIGVINYTYQGDLIVASEDFDILDVGSVELVVLSEDLRVSQRSFEYTDGKLSEISNFDGEGVLTSTTTYSYGGMGTLMSTITNSLVDGTTSSSTHDYEFGRCDADDFISIRRFICIN